MTIIATDLRNTRESARRLRFEPVSPITATDVQEAIEQAANLAVPVAPTFINFAMSPYAVLPADRDVLVDTSGGAVAVILGGAGARTGLDVTVRDITGNAAANPISVSFTGTTDGLASPIVIGTPFGGWTFKPLASGNWYLENT